VQRVRALRGLARRLEVTPVSILVSALVQADQAGASLTETLRRQADDLRGRRRERALVLAEGLPVKLVFPLVICFLPGLFVVTLGPAFQQFFQIVDRAAARGRR
jgi:tight adherence protein C